MKILLITYNEATEPLVRSQVIAYLKGLSKKGIRCAMLTFEKKRFGKKIFKMKTAKLKEALKPYDIRWHYLRYHKKPSLPATVFDIVQGIIKGLLICLKENIDIIHARSTVPAAMGYVIAGITRKKFIFDVRGLMAEEFVDGGMWGRKSFKYRITNFLEKMFMRKSDGMVVLSNRIKEFLEKKENLKKDITVIPCCVNLDKFRKTNSESLRKKYGLNGKFVFIYTGSLGTWYMAGEMLDFFTAAKKKISNAHFLFLLNTGRGILKEEINKKGIDPRDITIDKAEFQDMPGLISMADVGLFFIKPCLSKESSCPTKFAEYLACGIPVVINRGIGDTAEIVEKYNVGSVVNGFNGDSYQGAISNLLALQSHGIEELRKRCRETAEKEFSLEKGVGLYYDVYKKITGKAKK